MVKIKDLRSVTPRTNGTRSISQIKKIARHHSGGVTGNWASFWRHWNGTLGWGTGGYHEIILRDGTVELCYDPHEITNGVGGHNTIAYHICAVGNGSFTPEQEKVFEERCKIAMKRFGLKASDVLGHNEFSGQATNCPGINMNEVRERLGQSTQASKPASPSIKEHLVVDGHLGRLTIMALQRYFGTPVDGVLSKPSRVIMELQKFIGTKQDGYISEPSLMVRALQRRFGTPVDGIISKPSLMVMELQRRLNNGKL